jgi:5-methylcytosine-specific restriction endonuclease McrA
VERVPTSERSTSNIQHYARGAFGLEWRSLLRGLDIQHSSFQDAPSAGLRTRDEAVWEHELAGLLLPFYALPKRSMPETVTPTLSRPQPPTAAPASTRNFVRLTKEADRKAFYKSLTGQHWWTEGWKKGSKRGWTDVYELTDWKCVYCAKDLAVSTEALSESTQEHLVPRSLLDANDIGPNTAHNLGACCAGCNTLKGEHLPPADDPCWMSRKAYLKACRQFIAQQRYKKFQELKTRVEAVLKRRAGQ